MDWRSSDLMQMHLDMYTALANRYDNDSRIFAIQTGFGFWSEYHLSGKHKFVSSMVSSSIVIAMNLMLLVLFVC